MSDPLDDPRATDLLAARPDDVSALAANFRAAAGESDTTAAGLTAARNDGTWTGRAAEAFRHAIGRLPGALDRIRDGYSAVATTLTAYEPELSRIQAAFVQVVADRADAQSRLRIARATADTARTALATTERDPDRRSRALADAELAVAGADGALEGYRRELATLTGRALALLDEFAAVRAQCRDSIAAAQRTAPVRPESGRGVTVIPRPESGRGVTVVPPPESGQGVTVVPSSESTIHSAGAHPASGHAAPSPAGP